MPLPPPQNGADIDYFNRPDVFAQRLDGAGRPRYGCNLADTLNTHWPAKNLRQLLQVLQPALN